MMHHTAVAESGHSAVKLKSRPTILLVEDEKMIRNVMCELLDRAGYKVLACSGASEGIDTCRNYAGCIDLLLTDVMMPGMNGEEMAREILKMLPGLRVLFMSGYTEKALMQNGGMNPKFGYLQKPFKLDALTRKLAQMLETAEA